MSGIDSVLRTLHDDERDLEQDLLAAAERHRAEREFHHVATDVARWSREHAARLAARLSGSPRPPLAQAAQAVRDRELLEPVSSRHPQALRRMRWTNTMIRVLSPWLLVSA